MKNPGHVSLPSKKSDWVKSGKSLSLRDTKASALRRQAQLKKAAVLSEKPKHVSQSVNLHTIPLYLHTIPPFLGAATVRLVNVCSWYT